MKFLFLSVLSLIAMSAHIAVAAPIVCNTRTIDNVYIPQLRELAEWPDAELRPYAQNYCAQAQDRQALQQQIKAKAEEIRQTFWRVCNDVVPGHSGGSITSECRSGHGAKINALIDNCRDVVSLGHNPHNVGILMEEISVEVACLRGIATALNEGAIRN